MRRISLSNINSDYIIVMGLQVILNSLFPLLFSSLTSPYYKYNKENPNGKTCEKRGEFCSLFMS